MNPSAATSREQVMRVDRALHVDVDLGDVRVAAHRTHLRVGQDVHRRRPQQLHRVRVRAELRAPVHDRHRLRERFQHQRPVQRGVATADHDDVLAGVLGRVRDEVREPAAEVVAAGGQRPRRERADPAGDHDGAALDARARRGRHREAALAAFELDRLLAEQVDRVVRRGLLEQLLDQVAPLDGREPGDVEDRLLRVHRGDLAARFLQRVEHRGRQRAHAGVVRAEQPDRSGADDQQVHRQRCCLRHPSPTDAWPREAPVSVSSVSQQ